MLSKEATQGRFEETCREIVAFVVDKGLVRSKDNSTTGKKVPLCVVWLQSALDILVILFESIGLKTNHDKTKIMTCIPGNIRVAHTEEVYHAKEKGPINPTVKHH
jgi:hypothetical protein